MKMTPSLDRDDRRALATLGSYALLLLALLLACVATTLVLAVCVRLFVAVS